MGVAQSLAQHNLLQRFVTTLAVGKGHQPAFLKYLPPNVSQRLTQQLSKRSVPDFLSVPISTVELPEMMNLAARKLGLNQARRHRLWEWAEGSFDRRVASTWAGKAAVIYGCEHASVETFRRQKSAGGLNILWQVIAHHSTMTPVLEEEQLGIQNPTAYEKELMKSLPRINERKDRQYDDADLIITNSHFARQTFIEAGISSAKVRAVPTGCPPVLEGVVERRRNDRVIFLSAGMQSLRKGTHYLLEAWRSLPKSINAELWLIGPMHLPQSLLRDLPANVLIKPAVPSEELEQLLKQSSVLVLPTLGEGLAHIILEGLSAGLAIITTANSGCGELVEDDVNGWQVPVRDSRAIAAKILWCVENSKTLPVMQQASQDKARSWQQSDFVAEHARVVEEFLVKKSIVATASEMTLGLVS